MKRLLLIAAAAVALSTSPAAAEWKFVNPLCENAPNDPTVLCRSLKDGGTFDQLLRGRISWDRFIQLNAEYLDPDVTPDSPIGPRHFYRTG